MFAVNAVFRDSNHLRLVSTFGDWFCCTHSSFIALPLAACGSSSDAGCWLLTIALPKLEWFQNVESMLNHHLAGQPRTKKPRRQSRHASAAPTQPQPLITHFRNAPQSRLRTALPISPPPRIVSHSRGCHHLMAHHLE